MQFEIFGLDSDVSLGQFDFAEIPVLGSCLGVDSKHVICCVQHIEPRKITVIPRVAISKQKPFMSLDWHLGAVFCSKCTMWSRFIEIKQRIGFCPHCGPQHDKSCMDVDSAILEFNCICNEHPCVCDHCGFSSDCDVCRHIPHEPEELNYINQT